MPSNFRTVKSGSGRCGAAMLHVGLVRSCWILATHFVQGKSCAKNVQAVRAVPMHGVNTT